MSLRPAQCQLDHAPGMMEEPVEILRPEICNEGAESELKIGGFESIASYNWLGRKEPSLLVPGVPPIWSPPRITPHLEPDTGIRYVDQNTDRYPWSPLDSLVRAVYEMHPKFDFGKLNIVTDRRPLRKHFGFVRDETDDFEFGVEAIGKILLFVRMERMTRESIPPGAFQGYRREFEQAYTKLSSSAEGSTSHYRIARYNLGGLRLTVRSAFDAYLEEVALKLEASVGGGKEKHREEDLTADVKAALLGEDAPSTIDTPEAPCVHLIRGGENIPYAALLELKTRSKFGKKPWNIEEKMPDLWLSQTPTLIEAAHQNVGTRYSRALSSWPRLAEFVDIDVRNMHEVLNDW